MFTNDKHDKKQQKLIRLIEYKFGAGKCSEWRNRDFENLSFEIHKETKILISVATLKRYFGKVKTTDDYSPQDNTIEALRMYAGYAEEKEKGFSYKWVGVMLGIFIVLFVGWILAVSFLTENKHVLSAKLRLVKAEGKCPSTAFFEYSYYNVDDSVFIDFGDLSNWHYVQNDVRRSHFYAYPGYFNACLRTRDKVLSDSAKVYVQTDGWQAFACYFDVSKRQRYYPVPVYDHLIDGHFQPSMHELAALGLDTKEIVLTRLDNYRKTDLSADNMICKTRFKNGDFWPAVRCYSTLLEIQGEHGKLKFKFVGEGCSSYGELELSEIKRTGAHYDFSAFVVDNSQWVNAEVINRNKMIEVIVNGHSVFSESYLQSIGQVLGVSLIFHGTGSVDYINVLTSNEVPVIWTDF